MKIEEIYVFGTVYHESLSVSCLIISFILTFTTDWYIDCVKMRNIVRQNENQLSLTSNSVIERVMHERFVNEWQLIFGFANYR